MLVTYVDESARGGRFYFIGGLVVDQAGLVRIEQALDDICTSLAGQGFNVSPEIELHGYEVFQGAENWRNVPPRLRISITRKVLRAVLDAEAKFIIAGTDKFSLPAGQELHEFTLLKVLAAIEQKILVPNHARSLVIADDHHAAETSRQQFQSSRDNKLSATPLHRFVDTIYFGPSHHSRLLQAADMVTFLKARALTKTETDKRSKKIMQEFDALIDEFAVAIYFEVNVCEGNGQ